MSVVGMGRKHLVGMVWLIPYLPSARCSEPEGGYLEVCHHGASMGTATPSRLGWDEGAGQGH